MTEFELSLFNNLANIPKGKLISYGQLAKLSGYPNHARHVGKVLSRLPKDTKLPWFRVVNGQGKISLQGEGYQRQKAKLEMEGVEVNDQGIIINFKQLQF
ncbi:MAG: MGMT family protein [Psychromonas sp.]|nr:MGMT family protein [Alteromonadales bacterium]MCP5078682.1 MGMT family protein [Psychromonas sp.]